MKRLLFFLMATLFAMQGFSQATLNEGFEGTTFPPDDWAKVTTQGTEAWERYTSDAPRGLACASVNYGDPSHINYLITPKLIVSSDQDSIVYWVKTDYDFGGTTLNVLVSTTDNAVTSFSTTSLQTVSTLSESWVRKSIPLTNYIGEEIYIAFQVVDFFGSRVMLDDVTGPELFVPTCPRPRALTVSNPTTIGIDLGWTDDTGLVWNIEYMLATETDWTNATTLYSVMNPHTFTSLNASTSYKARVQTDCGIEQSDWTSPITFMTACDAITVLPYSDSFDTYGTVSGSFPPCWSRPVLNTATPYPSINTTNHTPPASIWFRSESATQPTYVITPQFPDDINTLRIKFWLRAESTTSSGAMEIGVMSDPLDLTTFELVATINPSTTDWTEYEYLFSGTDITGPNNYIAFKHVTVSSVYYYWLDDVIVDLIPECSKPGSISADNFTTTSADITWVPANQTDYAWWLYYKEIGSMNFDSVYISGLPTYSFTTLNPSTGYEVYLRTDCGSELSEETNIFSFYTACGEITSFPWSDNFDTYGTSSGSFPPCWTRPVINNNYGTDFPSIDGYTYHTSPASIKFQTVTTTPTYSVTPAFTADLNTLMVSFWLKAEGVGSNQSGTITVGVMSNPNDTTTFEAVQLISPSTTDWIEYRIMLAGIQLQGSGNYIAFKHNSNADYWYYWLDDVVVDYIPSCPRPDSVFSTSITQTYADIDIVPGDIGDTQWKIYHREVGTSTWTEDDVFAFPYQITGLTSDTPYEVFVKTLCFDGTYSDGSRMFSFRTPCENIITFPYTENFDTYGTGSSATSYPTCWSRNVSTYSTNNPYISSTNFSPPGAMYFYSYNNTRVVAVCNPVDPTIPINTLMLEFKMRYSTLDANGIQVGIMDDPNDFSTFVAVGEPQLISEVNVWEDKVVMLASYDGTGQYIALAAIAPASQYARAYIDDFVLDYTPDCPNVYGLSVGAASTTSVSVNWQDEGDDGSGYNLAYSSNLTTPFDPTTAIIIAVPTGTQLPYVIPGFSPGDSVWVAVQRGCLGAWTDVQKVILPEYANILPFTCDFEDPIINNTWTIYNGTQTNKWYIGAPGANDAGSGLYISDNDGVSANYSTSSTSTVHAINLIEFDDSPEFALGFDWKAYGEGTTYPYDYIKVFLIPIGIDVVAGTIPSESYQITPLHLNYSSTWQRETVSIGSEYSNTIQQLVFMWRNDGSDGTQPPASIDNIELVGLTCPSTTNLSADNITTTTADISWDSNLPTVSDWWIYWKQRSASSWTDSLNITNNPYTLSGLLPNTPYEVAIVNNCGTELSYPMNILEFRTSCDVISVLPYFEDFDTYGTGTSVMPACWTRTTTYADCPYVNSGGYSGNYLYFYAGTAGTYNIAAMTPIDASIPINTLMAAFYYKYSSATNILIVGVMTDPTDASTFDSVTTIQGTSSWAEYEVNFSSYTGSGEYIAFLVPYTTTYNYGYLDELVVDYIPACDRPSALSAAPSASGIGTDMDVSFTPAQPTDTEWYIFYKEASSSVWDSVYTTTTTTTIPGLTLQTAYNIYVKTVCLDGSYSRATAIITYATPCYDSAITTFPWIEGFESGLSCWTQEYVLGTVNWAATSFDEVAHTGTQFAFFSDESWGGYKTKLISPVLDLTGLSQPYLSFWHKQEAWGVDQDKLKVFYRTSIADTWTELIHYTTSIPSYILDSLALPNPSSTYQIAFEGEQNWAYGVAVDDITVYDLSTNPCATPTNIVVTPSNTTATVTWTAGDVETSWEVRLGTTGTPEVTSITNHPLTGLTPSTTYTVYVRANCGTGYSPWIPKQFTTTSQPTPPTVTTAVPSTLISQTTAVLNGTYVEVSDPILATGFEYKTVAETTWTDQLLVDATTPFTYSPTGLTPNTAYEAKAYVTTATFDKTYGNVVAFTTLAIIPPTVTTDSVRVVTETSANFYGKIIENTEAIEARGFEYKLSSEAWDDAINISASGVTTITATANTLTNGMSYDVRAYGRTLSETTYGLPLTFTPGSLNGVIGQDISIMMYPNPATSQTNLVVSGINGETKIVLSDVQGRILNTINAKPVSGTIEQTIDLNNLAKGVYYIRIQNSDVNRTQKLIVK